MTDTPIPTPSTEVIRCQKCGEPKPRSEFGEGSIPTKACKKCREYGRDAMRRYHERRRLGIAVERGRPRSADILMPTRIVFTVPRAIVAQVEQAISTMLKNYLKEHVPNHTAGDLPPGFEFGSELSIPRTTNRRAINEARSATASRHMPRPRNEVEQQFWDTCTQQMKDMLNRICMVNSAKPKWDYWDNHFNKWVERGRPADYDIKDPRWMAEKRAEMGQPPQPRTAQPKPLQVIPDDEMPPAPFDPEPELTADEILGDGFDPTALEDDPRD